MTGSIADYDELCAALEAYEAAPCPDAGWHKRFGRVCLYAQRCGKPGGVPTLPWAHRRAATYRKHIIGLSDAEARVRASINSLCPVSLMEKENG
jgi:hypothetical protein